jgi:hypothetical protein
MCSTKYNTQNLHLLTGQYHSDFKIRNEIFQRINGMPLSAKAVRDKTIKMAIHAIIQQIPPPQ